MFLVLIAVLAAAFMAVLGSVTSQNLATRDLLSTRTTESDLAIIGEAVEQFYTHNNIYPSSLPVLAATPGFGHVKTFADRPNVYGYRLATGISDGTNTFARAAVFKLNTKIGETSLDYTSGPNTCGSGAFDTAASWCGPRTSPWLRYESRALFIDQIGQHYARVYKIYQKVSQMYSPTKNPIYPAMTPSTDYIVNLVGYAGSAASCSGSFRLWGGVELDCTDLFSVWGTPVRIVRNSDTDITIGAAPP